MGTAPRTAIWALAVTFAAGLTRLPAQHEPAATPATKSAAEQKRGAKDAPTHRPQPTLPPLVAWQHIKTSNEAGLAAHAAGNPAPPRLDRPAGAGRYVCAVFLCADADVDIAATLGLVRADILLFSEPGPFVEPAAIALLEQFVRDEHLSLVLVLGHPRCKTMATPAGTTPRQDALARRLATVHADASRQKTSPTKALVMMQRDHLLAASEELRQRVAQDQLRIVPGEVDVATGALRWHHQRSDELPLLPVK